MYHKQKSCLDTCFLRLMFLLRGLFLFLLQQSHLKILFNVFKSLSRVHSGGFLSYSKKRKISQNDHSLSLVTISRHSLSFVVTRCLSLYHSLSLVITRCTTRCHLLSLVISLVCLFINDLQSLVTLRSSLSINFENIFKRS